MRREAEVVIDQFSTLPPEVRRPESVRANVHGTELRLIAGATLVEKINKIKGLLAHFEKLCDQFLQNHEKNLSKNSAPPRKAASKSRIVRAHIKRQIWRRDQGQCQICKSNYALQIDHIHPVALGGGGEKNNLRLLCHSCNQRAAIRKLGMNKMARFLGEDASE